MIKADASGISIFKDTSDTFGVMREATREDITEIMANTLEDEPLELEVGDKIPNEAWQPYIELIPKSPKKYGV